MRESLILRVVLAFVLICVGAVRAQGALMPSPRYSHSMAYDSVRNRVVLFGGNVNATWPGGALGDTWEWDGAAWFQRTPAVSPSPRGHGAMTYDPIRQRCVYFGGYVAGQPGFSETWEWNGSNWALLNPTNNPSPRFLHSMVWADSVGGIVLFGGEGGIGPLNDTWIWNGSDWLSVATSNAPSPRNNAYLAYDDVRQQVVLYGGQGSPPAFLGDTWIFDGINWSQRLTSQSPSARSTGCMVFMSSIERVVLQGGYNNGGYLRDTWLWDGAVWLPVVSGISPGAPMYSSLVYAANRQRAFAFGGWNGSYAVDAPWLFDGAQWSPELAYTRSPVSGNYYAVTPQMTWMEAETLAIQQGGHLATVRSSAENAWLRQAFGPQNLWIGFNDRAVEGQWVWASGEAVAFANWAAGEPNNSGNEDVAQMIASNGQWNDAPETFGFPGIIELPGGPTASLTPAALATTTPPAALTAHTLAPLPTSGALLFGGTTASGPQPFTYTLNGTTFTPQFPFLTPSVRSDHTLLLDPIRGNNVLFGGRNPLNTALADTWTWSNNQWSLATPATSPSPRSGHRMAFDAAAGVGLLFGGKDTAGNALNDFWAWNGTTWTQRTPSLLPPARSHHGMAYDPRRNRTVIHGGIGGTTRRDDVWEYDGANWREASAGRAPSERHGPALVRDSARNKLVLFGGRDGNGFLADTWELAAATAPGATGQEWTAKQTAAAPSPRNSHGMAYDAARGNTVLFGGFQGATQVGETWLFDGANWIRPTLATEPSPRSTPGMCFDSARGVLVLFGGFSPTQFQLNDTWEWNGAAWTQATAASSPSPRMFHAMAFDSSRQRTILFGGLGNGAVLRGDTWEYDGVTWTQVATTGPSPRQGAMLCFDPVRNETVLFGGGFAPAVSAETWVWNGTTWTQRTPATSPSARLQGAMAFDPARGKVVLYGGGSAGWASNFNDTWEWDGANWSPSPLVRADGAWNPGARDGHTMAYDPRSERVVMHGGEGGSGCLADVWSWDGSGWTLHLPQGTAPSARRGAAMYHDAAANELRLFAGGCGTSYTNDLWSLQLPVFARSEQFGAGCVGSIGAPGLALLAPSSPVVGTTMNLQVSNVPGVFIPALGAMGTSRTSWLGLPLPFDLAPAGIPGCLLHQSAEATLALGAPNGTGVVPWPIAIPNNPLLLGVELYFQALTLELPGFPRWSSLSNGLAVRLGDR